MYGRGRKGNGRTVKGKGREGKGDKIEGQERVPFARLKSALYLAEFFVSFSSLPAFLFLP